MSLTEFRELTPEEQDVAWAEMPDADIALWTAHLMGWKWWGFMFPKRREWEVWDREAKLSRSTGWYRLELTGGFEDPAKAWNPRRAPAASHTLLMWVREQRFPFRKAFRDFIYGQMLAWGIMSPRERMEKWLFEADHPDLYSRAVVQAACRRGEAE